MTTVEGAWHPGIGDPTPMGWITVAGYALAAWSCWRAGRAQGQTKPDSARHFWWLLTLGLAALGVNKQLDLQTWLTEIGRQLARAQGWYAQRHVVQIGLIFAVAAAGVAGALAMFRLAWPLSPGRFFAGIGLAFLLAFVLMRASSFHHVDALLASTAMGLRWNWISELSGIGAVTAGAWLEWRAARRGRPDR
jgi:hypothetical protein